MKKYIEDKKKLENDIKKLLIDFSKKYPDVVIQRIEFVHDFTRNREMEVTRNDIKNVMIQTYL